MKTLKFEHDLVDLVKNGEKNSTWRIRDDKALSVNDVVRLIDKVDPEKPETWQVFGTARIDRVIEKRLGDIDASDQTGHEKFASTEELLKTYQRYYDNDVSLTTPIKLVFFTLLPTEQSSVENDTTITVSKVTVYADGGSRGNPGPSASGFVIIEPNTKKVLVDKGVYLGVTTNNQAEYLALKYALEECVSMGVNEVDVYMDSMLVVNQLKGTFKIRNRDLWPIHDTVQLLLSGFKRYSITHIPRELNRLADTAVNRVLDEELGTERLGRTKQES